MKTSTILSKTTIILLMCTCLQSNAQMPNEKVELSSSGHRLNALFFPVKSESPVPTIVLLHGIPWQ